MIRLRATPQPGLRRLPRPVTLTKLWSSLTVPKPSSFLTERGPSPLRVLRRLPLTALLLLALLTLPALAAGCAGRETPGPVVSPVPSPTLEEVTLYFPHRTREGLVREVRQAERRGEQPERFALQQLLAGPRSAEARPVFAHAFSDGEIAVSAKVLGGEMVLLLTAEAADALAAGGDLLPVHAVVATLGSLARVETVQFRVEGREEPLVVAGTDLSQPLTPRWDLVLE